MIVQVLDYYSSGNAVANIAVTYFTYISKMGMESKIAARLINKHDNIINDIEFLNFLSDDDFIMYHLCIGTPLNDDIFNYHGKKILVYHNITPPEMLSDYDNNLANACEQGLLQLKNHKDDFLYCIADSEFNRNDLIAIGYDKKKCFVLNPYISNSIVSKKIDELYFNKLNDGYINFIFVGRLSPHKRQDELIRFFNYYKKNINSESRLILVGGGNGDYVKDLQLYVQKLNLPDVLITGQINFEKLLAIYKSASFFISLSDHEGYGIPLIEAMLFNVPVIGYDAGAVCETLGKSAILIEDKDPRYISCIVEKIRTDSIFRNKLISSQKKYLDTFLNEKLIFSKFQNIVKTFTSLPSVLNSAGGNNPYDVIIPVKASDVSILKYSLPYIIKNLNPKKIIIISTQEILNEVSLFNNAKVKFLDENLVCPGLLIDSVKKILKARNVSENVSGWYFQQFIKIAYALRCKDKYYLVWDADTVPLNKISMLDSESLLPCFDMKSEYVAPYFSTLKRLLNIDKQYDESFISEHMLFTTELVLKMIEKINDSELFGDSFFEKILNATDFSNSERAFSEFETFGSFCSYYYPNFYKKRHLRTFRATQLYVGKMPSINVLEWISKDFDIISFESQQEPKIYSVNYSNKYNFRKENSFKNLVGLVNLCNFITMDERSMEFKRALLMDYPYIDRPAVFRPLIQNNFTDYSVLSGNICLYGIGKVGKRLVDILKTKSYIYIKCICDNNVSDLKFEDIPIFKHAEFLKYYKNEKIVITSQVSFKDIYQNLLADGIPEDNVFFFNNKDRSIVKLAEAVL